MTEEERHFQRIATAVAVLTAMVEDRSGEQGLRDQVLRSYQSDSDLTDTEMAFAFCELAAVLLLKLEERGASMLAVLQDIALGYPPPP